MPKHGIDQVCTRRTPVSVLGTVGGPSWAQALVSPRMALNKFPSPYAIRGFAKLKKFQKSKNYLEVGGWVQVPFG